MKHFHTIGKWTCMLLLKYFDINKVFQTQKHIISFHFITYYSFGKSWSTRRTSVSQGQNLKKQDHYTKWLQWYSNSYSTSSRYFSWQIANSYSFLLHSNHIPIYHFRYLPFAFSDSSHSSPVTTSLVVIVTHM